MISRSYVFLLLLNIAISPVLYADGSANIQDSTESAVDMLLSDITSPAAPTKKMSKGDIIVPKAEQSFADTLNSQAQKMVSSAEKASKEVEKANQIAEVTTPKEPKASDLITAKGNSIEITPKAAEVEKATNDIKVITKSNRNESESARARMIDPITNTNNSSTRSNTPEKFDEGIYAENEVMTGEASKEASIKPASLSSGIGMERADGERLSAAMGHFARSHSLLIQAIREFDRGRQIAKPDAVLDTQKWRGGLVQRTKDIQRVLAPQPRVSNSGVRYEPDSRLLRVTGN